MKTTFRPGICRTFTKHNFEDTIKKVVNEWQHRADLKDKLPALAYVHPAEAANLPLSVIVSQGLTLPVRPDETELLDVGKVRICTDKEVEF